MKAMKWIVPGLIALAMVTGCSKQKKDENYFSDGKENVYPDQMDKEDSEGDLSNVDREDGENDRLEAQGVEIDREKGLIK